MVREGGLEPPRRRHTLLRRARLPVPPLSRMRLHHCWFGANAPGLHDVWIYIPIIVPDVRNDVNKKMAGHRKPRFLQEKAGLMCGVSDRSRTGGLQGHNLAL